MKQKEKIIHIMDELIRCSDSFSEALKDLNRCSDSFSGALKDLKAVMASSDTDEKIPKTANLDVSEPKYSIEDVRNIVMSKISEADGKFKEAVKAIVKGYANGGALRDVPDSSYSDLVSEIKELK